MSKYNLAIGRVSNGHASLPVYRHCEMPDVLIEGPTVKEIYASVADLTAAMHGGWHFIPEVA